jgi:hypothetical protein
LKIRGLLLAALIIVLLAVYYIVGTDYLKLRSQNRDLSLQVVDTAGLLAQTQSLSGDFEGRMAEAQANLDAAKEAFPKNLNTTRIVNTILKIAGETGVKAVPLATQDWTGEVVNGVSYLVFKLHITAKADLEHLSAFQERLETGEIPTLVIEHLEVMRLNDVAWGEGDADQSPEITAGMDIAVYSRPAE